MTIEDTGWKKPTIVTEGGETKGVIQPATGLEKNPCMLCRSFEKDTRKLIQHWVARGLKPDAEGYYVTPIVQDFDNRTSMRVHPDDYGYCRRNCYTTHMRTTCADFVATATRDELALKLAKR